MPVSSFNLSLTDLPQILEMFSGKESFEYFEKMDENNTKINSTLEKMTNILGKFQEKTKNSGDGDILKDKVIDKYNTKIKDLNDKLGGLNKVISDAQNKLGTNSNKLNTNEKKAIASEISILKKKKDELDQSIKDITAKKDKIENGDINGIISKINDIQKSLGEIPSEDLELKMKGLRDAIDQMGTFPELVDILSGALTVENPDMIRDMFDQWNNSMSNVQRDNENAHLNILTENVSFMKAFLHQVNKHKFDLLKDIGLGAKFGLGVGTYLIHQATNALNKVNDLSGGYFSQEKLEMFDEVNRDAMDRMGKETDLSSGLEQFQTAVMLRDTLGKMEDYSARTLANISAMKYTMGVSNEEAVKYLDTLRSINGATIDQNTMLFQQLALVSKKLNISYTKLMDTMSDNMEYFAKYSGVGLKNMLKMAVASQKLGVNMASMTNALEKLTSLDDIINNQMKMSIFLGQRFDLMESAKFQFEGKSDKAMLALLEQLGKVEKSQFDSPYMRKVLSEGTGLSISDLVKFYDIATDSDKMKQFNNEIELNKSIDNLNKQIKGLGFERLTNIFSTQILNPLQTMFANFAPMIEFLISIAGGIMKGVGGIISGIGMLYNSLYKFGEKFGEWGGSVVNGVLSLAGIVGTFTAWWRMGDGNKTALLRGIYNNTARIAFGNSANLQEGAMANFGFREKSVNGKKGKLTGKGKGALGIMGLLGASVLSGTMTEDDIWTSMLTSAFTGASIGLMTGNPYLAAGGAVVGGLLGGFSHHINTNKDTKPIGMATGGIVPDGYDNDTFPAKLSSNEAVIPLNSYKGENALKNAMEFPKDTILDKIVNGMDYQGVLLEKLYSNSFSKSDDKNESGYKYYSKNDIFSDQIVNNMDTQNKELSRIYSKTFSDSNNNGTDKNINSSESLQYSKKEISSDFETMMKKQMKSFENSLKNIQMNMTINITNKEDGRDKRIRHQARLSDDLVNI